jgi:hypothetical protein
MTDQKNPLDDIARGTEKLLEKGRQAAGDAKVEAGDTLDLARGEDDLKRQLRKAGRRVDRFREEQPVGFAIALAAGAILLGALIGRAKR